MGSSATFNTVDEFCASQVATDVCFTVYATITYSTQSCASGSLTCVSQADYAAKSVGALAVPAPLLSAMAQHNTRIFMLLVAPVDWMYVAAERCLKAFPTAGTCAARCWIA